jgi:hypothetical protein
MNKKEDDQTTLLLSLGAMGLLSGLLVAGANVIWQDGYQSSLKQNPPGATHISGDQIITNTNSSLSPFSGNGNTKKVETGNKAGK